MIRFNPDLHHRHSVHLQGYDYSNAGTYFVTVCTQKRECLFGEIRDGAMKLNGAGKTIEEWWKELTKKFRSVEVHEYVVMPNHFHGIITIVGADLRVCPDSMGAHTGAPLQRIQSHKPQPRTPQSLIPAESSRHHTHRTMHGPCMVLVSMLIQWYIK